MSEEIRTTAQSTLTSHRNRDRRCASTKSRNRWRIHNRKPHWKARSESDSDGGADWSVHHCDGHVAVKCKILNLVFKETEMRKTIEVYSPFPSRCCGAKQLLVRSRKGGFVTKGCMECPEGSNRVGEHELPELTCSCSPGETMRQCRINKNYSYICDNCGHFFELWTKLPWWDERLEYCGVATPNESWW
jgi:hypothetical protein